MGSDFLLYGSTGYVGSAVAKLAADNGLRPLLAGRNASAVGQQASELGLDFSVITLDNDAGLDEAMSDLPVVLNCAGPFVHTAESVVQACLRTGTHYLDISGEPPVYEAISTHEHHAESAGVMLLPSVGFDVIATDCLANHLARRLPTATHLTLAFHQAGPAGLPPGTLNTLVEMIPLASNKQHRVDGRVVTAASRKTRLIDFGAGPVEATMLTWGDLFQVYKSTGIPNIENYTVIPPSLIKQMDMTERIRPLFRSRALRNAAKKTMKSGATSGELARTTTSVWGEVTDGAGWRAVSRLHGPEGGVVWTSRAALGVVRHVLNGDLKPGYQAPSAVYGPDLVLETEGVTREDVAEQTPRGIRVDPERLTEIAERAKTSNRSISVLFVDSAKDGGRAAEFLASELSLPLSVIDVAPVVNKCIGETEKNLQRLLDRVGDVDAVLFFDEADALFGRRTNVKDSHDRYANQEVSYLLGKLEKLRGLVIVTTNDVETADQARSLFDYIVTFRMDIRPS